MKTNFTFKPQHFIVALLLITFTACKKDKQNPTQVNPTGKYQDGFYIINEGWYQHAAGSIGFFSYTKGAIVDSAFSTENPGKFFNPNTSQLESGTIFKGKLYLLTKYGGPLVVADAMSLKETGRIAAAPTNDFRAFLGIDDTKGLVSTSDGIYPINLSTLALGIKISTVSGEVGDMIKAGNYIFVLSADKGLVILNAADYTVAKTIANLSVGFAVTPDGSVWVAGDTSLDKINPSNLNVTTVTTPFTVNNTWGAWHPGSITASTKENTVFLANNEQYNGGTTIYKYTDGNAASINTAFITIAPGKDLQSKELYGKGIAYNATTNQLVVNTVESGFGTHFTVNDLDFYDPSSGALIKDIPFTGYYFPAIVVFH